MEKTPHHQYDLCLGIADPRTRDQQDLMQFPFFSLSKKRRIEPIIYDRNGVNITVRGLPDLGIANIWDSDFISYGISQLNDARERGDVISPRLWVIPWQFFLYTHRVHGNKSKGGKTYTEFKALLSRLQGTQITTNIRAGGKRITEVWSWIDSYKSHENESGKIQGIEVVLSDWLYRRVIADRTVLAISEDYFLLTGGIERWLYKIARKHCGNNDCWFFSTKILYDKYPSGREFRKFKSDLRTLVIRDCLPEYHTHYDELQDRVMFSPRENTIDQRRLPRSLREKK